MVGMGVKGRITEAWPDAFDRSFVFYYINFVAIQKPLQAK